MNETRSMELFWTAQQLSGSLSDNREKLIELLGQDPLIVYLEPRPGAFLLAKEANMPPLLAKEWLPCPGPTVLDEVRLFGAGAGLHAIDVDGSTRFMLWTLSPDFPEGERKWHEERVTVFSYPIEPLDGEAARRFDLPRDLLPPPVDYTVHEYRRRGELICWNLTKGEKSE